MENDREQELQDAIDVLLAQLRVQQFALLELLQLVPRHDAMALANGLRARVNEWTLAAGHRFTPTVDETTSEHLATFLTALDSPSPTPAQLQIELCQA